MTKDWLSFEGDEILHDCYTIFLFQETFLATPWPCLAASIDTWPPTTDNRQPTTDNVARAARRRASAAHAPGQPLLPYVGSTAIIAARCQGWGEPRVGKKSQVQRA